MKHLHNYISEALIKNHIKIGSDMVDLGLSSGTLWAPYNLGANAPEEYGNYYIWGNVKDSNNDKCSWENAPFNNGKKNFNESYRMANKDKLIDENNILLPENDAATVQLGKGWCIPTETDVTELIKETTLQWIKIKGIPGRLFTSNKNGNVIFIPAAGYKGGTRVFHVRTNGSIWTSSSDGVYLDYAYALDFNDNRSGINGSLNYYGLPIRPVYKK